MLTVVKVGGRLTGDDARLGGLARSLAALAPDGQGAGPAEAGSGAPAATTVRPGSRSASGMDGVVVVHGGGSEITGWQERLGVPVVWREGLRVTTPEGMRVAAMVLSGWVNKRLVSALISAGRPAAGLSGEDGLLHAVPRDGGRLGEVGEVVAVGQAPLRALLGAGILPVVSPVSRGPEGRPLNVNADEAALALAVGLGARRLLLISDVPGVVVNGRVLPALDAVGAAGLLERGAVDGGMAVKVRQALEAARAGVEVWIGDASLLSSGAGAGGGSGTTVRAQGGVRKGASASPGSAGARRVGAAFPCPASAPPRRAPAGRGS